MRMLMPQFAIASSAAAQEGGGEGEKPRSGISADFRAEGKFGVGLDLGFLQTPVLGG